MDKEKAIKLCEDFIKNHSAWSVEEKWAEGVEFILNDYKRLLKEKQRLDKIKSEIVNASYTHYFEFGEYIGEDSKAISIVNLNNIEQIFDKYSIEREE